MTFTRLDAHTKWVPQLGKAYGLDDMAINSLSVHIPKWTLNIGIFVSSVHYCPLFAGWYCPTLDDLQLSEVNKRCQVIGLSLEANQFTAVAGLRLLSGQRWEAFSWGVRFGDGYLWTSHYSTKNWYHGHFPICASAAQARKHSDVNTGQLGFTRYRCGPASRIKMQIGVLWYEDATLSAGKK